MNLGELRLTTVSGGNFRIDGGTMFGVVPKVIWKKVVEVDEANTIAQATNCLLVETPKRHILIDTGYGSKLPDKQRRQLSAEDGDPLLRSLQRVNVKPEQIDLVILTHLHFDHAGGCLRRDEAGELVTTFPNAEYVIQRGEWELASADLPELQNAYPPENFEALSHSGQLRLIDGEAEITTGLTGVPTPGHTDFHQSILIESQGEAAVYLGDLCPSSHHLSSHWCMSYDTQMVETRRQKPRQLSRIADNNWLALFDHDPLCAAARISRDPKRQFVPTELIKSL